jgi:hypothetical protein
MKDSKAMIEYLFENQEELNMIPTRELNIWASIDGYVFKRRVGILCFEPKNPKAVRTLQDQVAELRSIIKALIATNGLRLPDDVIEDQE